MPSIATRGAGSARGFGFANNQGASLSFSGGVTYTLSYISGYKVYRVTATSTTSETFTVSCIGSVSVDYVCVAGGGGSGETSYPIGGGGAGGYRSGTISFNDGESATVTVGAGGIGTLGFPIFQYATPGAPSVFKNITAAGGGCHDTPGGSGGGNSNYGGSPGGTGNTPSASPAQGYPGGTYSGGGGGAGGPGLDGIAFQWPPPQYTGGNGGPGALSSITGTPTYYAGGGGGGYFGTYGGTGGVGGGGPGAYTGTYNGVPGTANTGGGAGGGHESSPTVPGSCQGGSGVVIIRVPN